MAIVVYGIRNCNTMKKTFEWFETHRIGFDFHDYRKAGIEAGTLARWCDRLGWQALVNTRGTTWRKLEPGRRTVTDTAGAVALMMEFPSLIRRPVVETSSGSVLVGYDEEAFGKLLPAAGACP